MESGVIPENRPILHGTLSYTKTNRPFSFFSESEFCDILLGLELLLKYLYLPEKFENHHVILTQSLICFTRANDITDKRWPIFGPFILQNLKSYIVIVTRNHLQAQVTCKQMVMVIDCAWSWTENIIHDKILRSILELYPHITTVCIQGYNSKHMTIYNSSAPHSKPYQWAHK